MTRNTDEKKTNVVEPIKMAVSYVLNVFTITKEIKNPAGKGRVSNYLVRSAAAEAEIVSMSTGNQFLCVQSSVGRMNSFRAFRFAAAVSSLRCQSQPILSPIRCWGCWASIHTEVKG